MMLVGGALLLPSNRENVCECEMCKGIVGVLGKEKFSVQYLSHYRLEI